MHGALGILFGEFEPDEIASRHKEFGLEEGDSTLWVTAADEPPEPGEWLDAPFDQADPQQVVCRFDVSAVFDDERTTSRTTMTNRSDVADDTRRRTWARTATSTMRWTADQLGSGRPASPPSASTASAMSTRTIWSGSTRSVIVIRARAG